MAKKTKRRKTTRRENGPEMVSITYLAIFALVIGIFGIIYVFNVFPPLQDAVLGVADSTYSSNP